MLLKIDVKPTEKIVPCGCYEERAQYVDALTGVHTPVDRVDEPGIWFVEKVKVKWNIILWDWVATYPKVRKRAKYHS